jgi:hypothetical protein
MVVSHSPNAKTRATADGALAGAIGPKANAITSQTDAIAVVAVLVRMPAWRRWGLCMGSCSRGRANCVMADKFRDMAAPQQRCPTTRHLRPWLEPAKVSRSFHSARMTFPKVSLQCLTAMWDAPAHVNEFRCGIQANCL